ncbi:MAG: aminoglycoside phosphotransferase family protein [Anaerolineae bacterium]|nr:aminoglycoside phosphotransferase family protein [Anaerolineae bacterium]
MTITDEIVRNIIAHNLPGRKAITIEDRGVWIRHNFRITLDTDEIIYLKIDQSFPASEKEAFICDLLSKHHLPAPPVIAVDTSGAIIPNPYILQKHCDGVKLERLLAQENEAEHEIIYFAIGKFYRKLHNIQHPYSGWIDGPGRVYNASPNEHQYQEVIVKIGQRAVDNGRLSASDHNRLQHIWTKNLEWLDQHQPSLIGGSFLWTLYLAKKNGEWQVTKMMDLEDLLYWDAAWDLMNIQYPAFGEKLKPAVWQAFREGYGETPCEKRRKLYLLLQRLDAGMGNYLEPETANNRRWRDNVWKTFPKLLDEVENLRE